MLCITVNLLISINTILLEDSERHLTVSYFYTRQGEHAMCFTRLYFGHSNLQQIESPIQIILNYLEIDKHIVYYLYVVSKYPFLISKKKPE